MEKAGKVAIPGRFVINTSEDVAKQEERASDSSVQGKICVSVSPMFCYIDSDMAIWTQDLCLVIYRHDLHLRLTYQAFGPSVV